MTELGQAWSIATAAGKTERGGKTMIWALIGLFVVLWIVAVILKGFAFIGIHVLLVIAVILLVVKLFSGSKS